MQYPSWTNGVIWHIDKKGQRNFIKSRYKILYGGRASSKSWTAGQALIELSCVIDCRVLCTREVQKTIAASSKKLLEDTVDRYQLNDQFKITDSYIKNIKTGATFGFFGLRDTNGIKSMEGIDITWVEEGETLTQETIDDVFPTIRKAGSEVWVTFNPKYEDSPVYQMFVANEPPPRSIVKKINYTDNPFVTEETLSDAEHCKRLYPKKYDHIWLGNIKTDSDEYTVLPLEMLMRCKNAHLKIGNYDGRSFGGLDLASGESEENDANSLTIRKGPVVTSCDEWQCSDIESISKKCGKNLIDSKAISLTYDAVGVGGFAEKPLKRHSGGKFKVMPFMGGGKVFKPDEIRILSDGRKISNRDYFRNAKSQQWWNLRDRLENTIALLDGREVLDPCFYLSFDSKIPNIDDTLKELSQATYEEDSSGRIKIDKAPSDRFIVIDGKKKKVKSPNKSDSIGYAFSSDFSEELSMFDVL